MENYVSELRGYLQSLSRLGWRKCDFFADSFLVEIDIHTSIKEYVDKFGADLRLAGIKPLNYNEVENLLKKYLVLELKVESQNTIDLFLWDIVEYFGLVSTASNPDGDFNPLVRNGALGVEIQSSHYSSSAIFVVVIGKAAIITWLSSRA